MAKAGVSYFVGRESNSQYGETINGIQIGNKNQLPGGIDPYAPPSFDQAAIVSKAATIRLVYLPTERTRR